MKAIAYNKSKKCDDFLLFSPLDAICSWDRIIELMDAAFAAETVRHALGPRICGAKPITHHAPSRAAKVMDLTSQ